MKKSLLALAAMGAFAGAAQAQSSVTVYGVFDGGYAGRALDTKTSSTATATTVSHSDFSGNQAASSRLGFRGVEDLGGGLSATFNLEFGFESGTGTLYTTTLPGVNGNSQSDGVRTSVIGLSSKNFGTLNIGRQLSGMHGIVAGNVFGGNNMYGDITYGNFTNSNAISGRISNVATRFNGVSFTTLNFSGFTARIDYSANRGTGANSAASTGGTYVNADSRQTANQGIRVNYDYKQFGISAGQHKVISNSNVTTVAGTETTVTINAVQARYRDKGLLAEVTYGNNKGEAPTAALANGQTYKNSALKFSASYQVTPQITPFIQYGTGASTSTVSVSAGNTANNNTGYQAGAMYSMSKRTNLYAAYGYQKSENKTSTASVEGREVGVGILHTF